MLAVRMDDPRWKLTPAEAEELAARIQAVEGHIQVKVDPMAQDIVKLALVAGTIYGSRIIDMYWLDPKKPEGPEQPRVRIVG
jgi:hypothetical protein